LAALRAAGEGGVPLNQPTIDLNLEDGLGRLERLLDAARPAGARVLMGTTELGRIHAEPGAEPLRGPHLRRYLTTGLKQSLLDVMTVKAATGDPPTWPIAAGCPPASREPDRRVDRDPGL
jgi:hypothetical protein